jgi:hypothetical protein
MTQLDWRLPENRREGFQRFYTHSLSHLSFPGMVYSMLPAIADAFRLDEDGRAWLAWLNGNTQNVVTSTLLLEAAPRPQDWKDAVNFWNEHFKALEWDTDRRHQKSKFGVATEQWFLDYGYRPAADWEKVGARGWEHTWKHAKDQPYMGRLSAWSMLEFARILLGADVVPDMGTWLLDDVSGSRSHRNGLAVIAGHDAWSWPAEAPSMLGIVPDLEALADDLLAEARDRNPDDPIVSHLTIESALCTYKSHYKENRRYPNVYADMMYNRIRKAEVRFGRRLELMWDIRQRTLPDYLRLEDNPRDPGLAPVKQNHFRETGEFIFLHREWLDTEPSTFDLDLEAGRFPVRKDPSWAL